jgi:dihydroorotate dehydrogenase (fumarate)
MSVWYTISGKKCADPDRCQTQTVLHRSTEPGPPAGDHAGADGLVLFNRFYQPDFDLDELEVIPNLVLSTSQEMRLPLRWIAMLYGRIQADFALTTGVHTAEDAIKAIMAGSSVAMMTSALLKHGPEYASSVLTELQSWMEEREYESVTQMKGSMSQQAVADPSAFARSNYIRVLSSYILSS